MSPRVAVLSLVSGIAWAGVALVVGRPMSSILRGGMIAAPLIGLLAGLSSAWFPATRVKRALFSLVSLYAAAALFGLAMGVYDWMIGPNVGVGSQRIASGVILQAAVATLWGLTFQGWFLLLWPLAYANHALLARAWSESGRTVTATG